VRASQAVSAKATAVQRRLRRGAPGVLPIYRDLRCGRRLVRALAGDGRSSVDRGGLGSGGADVPARRVRQGAACNSADSRPCTALTRGRPATRPATPGVAIAQAPGRARRDGGDGHRGAADYARQRAVASTSCPSSCRVRRTPLRYEGRVEPGPMGHCALGPTSTWVETRRGLRVSPTSSRSIAPAVQLGMVPLRRGLLGLGT
jgi:hypothetical protein